MDIVSFLLFSSFSPVEEVLLIALIDCWWPLNWVNWRQNGVIRSLLLNGFHALMMTFLPLLSLLKQYDRMYNYYTSLTKIKMFDFIQFH
jgi:hypothetical protein